MRILCRQPISAVCLVGCLPRALLLVHDGIASQCRRFGQVLRFQADDIRCMAHANCF